MIQYDLVLEAVYSVLNMAMLVFIGFLLAKFNVLNVQGRRVMSGLSYYILIPIFSLIFIMQAISKEKLDEFGLVLISIVPCLCIAFLLTLAVTYIFKFDVRIRYAFVFANVYMNFIAMALLLAGTLCDQGGMYVNTLACKKGLVPAYTSVPLIFLNFLYWVTVLPALLHEKRIALEIKRIFAIVLNYYDTVDEFLKDVTFKNAVIRMSPKTKKNEGNITKIDMESPYLNTPHKLILDLNSPQFIHEYYSRVITPSEYSLLKDAFQKFEEEVYNQPNNLPIKKIIEESVLIPAQLQTLPPSQKVFTFQFFKDRILLSPPAFWSLLAVILGFIFPVKEFLFDPENKPLPTFISTLRTVGNMVAPIAMFLLGSYLAEGVKITKDMLIGWRHVIISNVLRNLVMPAIGLFWILVVIKNMNKEVYSENPVLMFIDYTHWIVPTGVVLISVYVVAEYFTQEFSVIALTVNIVSLPMMTVFLILYFSLYQSWFIIINIWVFIQI
eukprot:TRINITY_DN2506_c0_g1_i1.p1 TRINITY_DN2506_c0_g1~~TRINITY_DN2506_c0_g1_i1.p1  ORF type:complete len:530 (+),score=34.01 TRINITY_DN2506_c0_g1_i1:101-1591(+)